jgi:hypothetical protein
VQQRVSSGARRAWLFDVLVISEDEARAWRDVRGSVIQAALAEGRPLAA